MNEELDKFEKRIQDPSIGKVPIDFKQVDIEFNGKQIDLGSIKYKKKKRKLQKEVIDLKPKKSASQNLFE
jgi:hypothetical protein